MSRYFLSSILSSRRARFALLLLTLLAVAVPWGGLSALAQETQGTAGKPGAGKTPTSEDSTRREERNTNLPTNSPTTELRVFGANLFTGAFGQQPFAGFNPDYQIMIGDAIQVQLWGAVEYTGVLKVDAQGNIFVPKVGPIKVLGIRNNSLTKVVQGKVGGVYRKQVSVYANLEGAQPVSVLVSGFVKQPGLYRGLSSDSVLYFMDLAGGVDPQRGSFVAVRVLRNGTLRQTVNLYDFLFKGSLPTIQFADGDTIHVGPIANTVSVVGAVRNAARFEFSESTMPAATVVGWASPRSDATHFRVERNNAGDTTAKFLPLIALDSVVAKPGDRITVVAEDRPQVIVIKIAGEHEGAKEFAVSPNTRLDEIINQIAVNERSNLSAVQLFRVSVKNRQRVLLNQSLDRLEQEILSSRSSTDEEASLRLREAELIQGFIARARKLEPQGLVVLEDRDAASNLYLEDGDTIFIPRKTNLITVAGEVMFPTAVVWRNNADVKSYIKKAGGYTRTADTKNVLLRRANGEITRVRTGAFGGGVPQAGDEIMVLPQPNVKNLQLAKTLAEILFQLAITTRTITAL